VDDAAFAALRRHFNSQEIIELTAVTGAFEFFTRMNTALRIPVTPLPADADAIHKHTAPASNTRREKK